MTSSKYPFIARGNQRYNVARSVTFNIDAGSGTTVDDVILSNLEKEIQIVSVKAVYVEATDTSGAASAHFTVGTTAGGTDIVASTALAVSKAVGSTTPATLAASRVAAGGALFARLTGIAATEAGQFYLQVVYLSAP